MGNIKKNFAFNILYQILNMLILLITTPYISRVIGAKGIGDYSYNYSIAYYFVIFAMLGLNNYGNRTIAAIRDKKAELSKTFFSIYAMQLLFALSSVILYIGYCLLNPHTVISWIMMLYVLSAMFDINWFFFGLEQFKITVIRSSILKIAATAAIFVFVRSSSDVYLYSFIMTFTILLSQLLIWPFLKSYIVPVKIHWQDIKVHMKPNIYLFIPVISVSVFKTLDKVLLGFMVNTTQVGYYESVEKIIQLPLAIVGALGIVMIPRISNMINKMDAFDQPLQYMEKSIAFIMFMTSSICFGIMAVAKEFVPIYYGPGFDVCVVLFQIMMPSCLFVSFANVILTQYLLPFKKDNITVTAPIVGAVVSIFCCFVFIPQAKAVGAAFATLITEIAVFFYTLYRVRKNLPIFRYLKVALPFCLSGFMMYACVYHLQNLSQSLVSQLIIKIAIGVLIYFSTLAIQLFIKQQYRKMKRM